MKKLNKAIILLNGLSWGIISPLVILDLADRLNFVVEGIGSVYGLYFILPVLTFLLSGIIGLVIFRKSEVGPKAFLFKFILCFLLSPLLAIGLSLMLLKIKYLYSLMGYYLIENE